MPTVFLFAVLVASCLCAAPEAPPQPAGRVELTLVDRPGSVLEPFRIGVTLRNTGDAPFVVREVGLTPRFDITVLNDRGDRMPPTRYAIAQDESPIRDRTILHTLRPGDARYWELVLNRYRDLTLPGAYTATLGCEIIKVQADGSRQRIELRSNTVAFRHNEPDRGEGIMDATDVARPIDKVDHERSPSADVGKLRRAFASALTYTLSRHATTPTATEIHGGALAVAREAAADEAAPDSRAHCPPRHRARAAEQEDRTPPGARSATDPGHPATHRLGRAARRSGTRGPEPSGLDEPAVGRGGAHPGRTDTAAPAGMSPAFAHPGPFNSPRPRTDAIMGSQLPSSPIRYEALSLRPVPDRNRDISCLRIERSSFGAC